MLILPAAPGENAIVDRLEQLGALERRALRSPAELSAMLSDLSRGAGLRVIRTRLGDQEAIQTPSQSGGHPHLVRLWAAEEAHRQLRRRSAGARADAAAIAIEHRLVTPASGAVVLETQAQYAAAGLEPGTLEQAPIVPEPGAFLLLGAAALLVLRRPVRLP